MKIDVKPILENALALIEVEVEKAIEAKCDAAVEAGVEALVIEIKKIAPDWADAIVEGAKADLKEKIKPVIKAQLLGLAEKISEKV